MVITPLVQRDAPLLNVQSQFKVFFFSVWFRYLEYNDFAMFPDGLFEDTFSLQYLWVQLRRPNNRNKKYVNENIDENCQKEIRNFTYHCIYTTSLHSDSSLEV